MGRVSSDLLHRWRHAWRLALVLVLLAVPAAFSQVDRHERITSFDVAVRVNPDSTMDVLETITIWSNGQTFRHGILRDFPTRYSDGHGNVHVVGFHVNSVRRDNQPERYNVSPWQNGQRVKIGRADVNLTPGEHTYAIEYRTDHQLGFFDDHDELYWNATGFWQVDIDKATASVTLPHGISPKKMTVTAYTGPNGAKGKAWTATVSPAGSANFATTARLRSSEGLTIVVEWPKGFVTPLPPRVEPERSIPSLTFDPGWWKIKTLRDQGGTWMAGACVLLLVLCSAAWFAVGRDPEGRSITVAYDPPEKLSPAAVRYLWKLDYDSKTFTSAVLSLASKKYLTIEYDGSTYVLKRTTNDAPSNLSSDEQSIAVLLFMDANVAKITFQQYQAKMADFSAKHPVMGQLLSGLASALTAAQDEPTVTRLKPYSTRVQNADKALRASLRSEYPRDKVLKTNGWFVFLGVVFAFGMAYLCLRPYPGLLPDGSQASPQQIFAGFSAIVNLACMLSLASKLAAALSLESFPPRRSVWQKIGMAVGTIIVAAVAAASGWVIALMTSAEWAIAFSAMWLTIGIFHILLKAPTETGQKVWDEIQGFRMFLSEVDEDRLNRMNPPNKTPELFERMLPYAIALECENAWAKQFQNVLAAAAATQSQTGSSTGYTPSWYSGPMHGANLASFTSSFSSAFGSAISSSATVPGSSSGSGGGGSSGGGGGGGGGGGW